MLTGFARSSHCYSVEMLMINDSFVPLPSRKPYIFAQSSFFFFLLLARKIKSQLGFTD